MKVIFLIFIHSVDSVVQSSDIVSFFFSVNSSEDRLLSSVGETHESVC